MLTGLDQDLDFGDLLAGDDASRALLDEITARARPNDSSPLVHFSLDADDDQRRRLVDAARSAGTVLVADETMSELWLDADVEMPRAVCAFDPAGSTVITVGSASKAFWAGMRIGWVRAAPDVIRSLVAARAYADMGTPVLEQLAVNWLFGTDGWERAVEIRRAQARQNRDELVGAVRAAGSPVVIETRGGLEGQRADLDWLRARL